MAADRNELLKKLHSLPFCMSLTALTDEYCLEVSLISGKGTSYSWESFEDFNFNAYCLEGLSENEVALIKEHIQSKSLYLNDFKGTQLEKIIPAKDNTIELSDIFANFLELPDEKIESLYCYKDPETGCIYVSSTEEKLSDILNEQYPVDTEWEELSDEQLADAVEEYGDIECEIPFLYLEDSD